jgi:hypothetical protein
LGEISYPPFALRSCGKFFAGARGAAPPMNLLKYTLKYNTLNEKEKKHLFLSHQAPILFLDRFENDFEFGSKVGKTWSMIFQ